MSPTATQRLYPETEDSDYLIAKRDGSVVPFHRSKIAEAIAKAYVAVHGDLGELGTDFVKRAADRVVMTLTTRKTGGGTLHIESVQDTVEMCLMQLQEHQVGRAYILYREARNSERKRLGVDPADKVKIIVRRPDGSSVPLDLSSLRRSVNAACAKHPGCNPTKILNAAERDLFSGMTLDEVYKALVMSARALVETDPRYSYIAASLLMLQLRTDALGAPVAVGTEGAVYAAHFSESIRAGVEAELLSKELLTFDLSRLAGAIHASRDEKFDFLGLQTIADRYLLNIEGRLIELPQAMFMRVAMGLALNESDKNARAIEFYELLSSFDFMNSTPTLFNSGTTHSQLSSCYLTTIPDDLAGIFNGFTQNALLSKYAGGLGNDWTPVRALGAPIKGTNGKSQGVVPFLKVANDTAVAVNQGGKRKGAVCAYLESWHLDIEEFLDARKNTGDDRRRTHDMNTANWIPDLFMKRVMQDGSWTLFSPSDVPDLHEIYGLDFERRYAHYESLAELGQLKLHKTVKAKALWRKMLSMLFETGHPWIAFKDPCNIRSPQQHVGVVHSSNLCTEITLNTSADEVAVCNLGSVNLVAHLRQNDAGEWTMDMEKLSRTVRTAMRMLDNVIDINYYPVPEAERANLRHRPVGLGIMGFQDCLHKMRVPYASMAAVEFADRSMEAVAYYAYLSSAELASERGTYSSFKGSLWDQGVLPQDTYDLLEKARGGYVEIDRSSTLDWSVVRAKIKEHGMRNSNCLAIAPTATIANIIGVSASIEPAYQNLFVKSNLSGEFTVLNSYMVADLESIGMWDSLMVAQLKNDDGSVANNDRVPPELKLLYATAFEIETKWPVEAAARRQKWIDQGQSLNIYIGKPSGALLHETYTLAWLRGLKTTYYLRTLAATSAEKSTSKAGSLNAVAVSTATAGAPETEGGVCNVGLGEECQVCQ